MQNDEWEHKLVLWHVYSAIHSMDTLTIPYFLSAPVYTRLHNRLSIAPTPYIFTGVNKFLNKINVNYVYPLALTHSLPSILILILE